MANDDSSHIYPDPTLLQRLGGRETVWRIVDAFYDHVETDPELRPLFPESLQRGRNMQKLFLEEWLGGASLYSQLGTTRSGMQSAHYRFVITKQAAGRWLHHMGNALQECDVAPELVAEIMAALGPLAHLTVNEGESFDRVQEVLILASRGDLAAVREAVERNPKLVSQKGTTGRTLLWEATRRGHREIVAFLLQQRGAAVNAPGGAPVMITPYALAQTRGHDDIADDLLAHGAVVDVFTAAYLGDMERLTALLDDDSTRVSSLQPAEDVNPVTPLHYAVNGGQLGAAKLLIDRGAEVEIHTATLLSWAASQGRSDLIELLKAPGAENRPESSTG